MNNLTSQSLLLEIVSSKSLLESLDIAFVSDEIVCFCETTGKQKLEADNFCAFKLRNEEKTVKTLMYSIADGTS